MDRPALQNSLAKLTASIQTIEKFVGNVLPIYRLPSHVAAVCKLGDLNQGSNQCKSM